MSSSVFASFDDLDAAAQNLTGIGSAIRSAHTAAAPATTQVAAAAQDEVSTAVAAVFGGYAQHYQALLAQAGLFHDQFVQTLTHSTEAYTATEAANKGYFPLPPRPDRDAMIIARNQLDRERNFLQNTLEHTPEALKKKDLQAAIAREKYAAERGVQKTRAELDRIEARSRAAMISFEHLRRTIFANPPDGRLLGGRHPHR